ncbi:NAD(P)/FAD-dependent oxidoreductase [Streptomyces diacarni]|uniref:NAD(P)/FAD-dependent oxidoreductase n=1 Tax=Streptomyces diacarni TaxID=2800381 RepID=A0A367EBY0_9ACTN|nr:FAD-dependent oxidoreductase [Streptomyces diacarni]RCG15175.1 NAD(P)/FAD-dependent oxidoreductase [Streptomyces diacarni]
MSRVPRVVVVGNGMVGARLFEEVLRRDPLGRRMRLTVLGDEPVGGYNRVLLPGLLSGALAEDDVAPGRLAPSHLSDSPVRGDTSVEGPFGTGSTVTTVDRAARTVMLADGRRLPYDRLVLATGARPVLPPLPGLCLDAQDDASADGFVTTPKGALELARDVTALRTLTDARRLLALADRARGRGARIAVLGGGVLGLEAARALAARGVAVTVVHATPHLMDQQLDAPAGRILSRALRRLGIEQRLGTSAVRWEAGVGVHLTDGTVLPAAGLLLCTGARPETTLAEACGLAVGPGGIAVDEALTTSDPAIHALGDCADADPGLVQPGWEQAAVLAARLTGENATARYLGTPRVTRLKAAGIELTSLGDPFVEDEGTAGDGGPEILRIEDPARDRYAKLVLHGDRVTGAILLGVPDAAAGLVQLFDSGALAPSNRLALLLGRALPTEAANDPEAMPDRAMVCRCNTVTKGGLRSAWHGGARTPQELIAATRATTGCGGCRIAVEKLAAWLAETGPAVGPTPHPS